MLQAASSSCARRPLQKLKRKEANHMANQVPWNYLKGCWKRDGKLPVGYKQYEPHFRNGTAGAAASTAAAVPPLTAAQEKAFREARESRQAATLGAAGGNYSGADFQSLVEQLRERKGLSYTDAFCAVLKTEQGQAAHKAFLKAKNPGINFEE
jgi:hypothetical protein